MSQSHVEQALRMKKRVNIVGETVTETVGGYKLECVLMAKRGGLRDGVFELRKFCQWFIDGYPVPSFQRMIAGPLFTVEGEAPVEVVNYRVTYLSHDRPGEWVEHIETFEINALACCLERLVVAGAVVINIAKVQP